jgi:2-hydroxychromene-2-carboxylate isomerase
VPRTPPPVVDRLARRVAPRVIVAHSQLGFPSRALAAVRRRAGARGTVELYFAFDDACSAVAVLDLAERLTGRDVRLVLAPVVRRGIDGDPAVDQKRRHGVADAARLARRRGLVLRRESPLRAQDTAFLAAWVAGAPPGPARQRFVLRALERLWFEEPAGGPVIEASLAALWRLEVGSAPVADDAGWAAVRRNERRMRRRGPYDTPAAWVHGQWFFAQDRGPQIAARLDDLGWTVAT